MLRFTAFALLCAVPTPALAWNKAGHMVSGAIAYHVLKQENPEALARVIRLLKAHPQFDQKWARRIGEAPEADRDLTLFMLAARWPDDIRDDLNYHQSRWHYINVPFKPAGQPDTVVAPPPDADNIVRAFEINCRITSSASASDDQKAIALCWVFHLVGDGHQPLHATALYTTDYPRGDRGGNLIQVRVKPDSPSIVNLHKFWDDLVIGSDNTRNAINRAIALRHRPEFAKDKLGELSDTKFEHWVRLESFQVARDVAYRNGAVVGHPDPAKAPVLPADYIPEAKLAAERRIVLAGYRLAELLKRIQ